MVFQPKPDDDTDRRIEVSCLTDEIAKHADSAAVLYLCGDRLQAMRAARAVRRCGRQLEQAIDGTDKPAA